jgi:hypothetical protein
MGYPWEPPHQQTLQKYSYNILSTTTSYTLRKHNIIDYYRYIDGIPIIYDEDHTNIDDTLRNSTPYIPIFNTP